MLSAALRPGEILAPREPGRDLSPRSLEERAGPAVLVSSFSIVLLGLHQVSTAVLQGLGHPKIPMINMILAAAVKVGDGVWHLVAGLEAAQYAEGMRRRVAAGVS